MTYEFILNAGNLFVRDHVYRCVSASGSSLRADKQQNQFLRISHDR